MPLGIFRERARVGGDIVAGLAGAWVAAEVLVVSLYSQEVLGYSALAVGLVAIPQGAGGILRGIVGPRLLDRVGIRDFLVGNCLLAAVGLAVLFRFPVTSHYPLLGLVFIVIGFGTTNVVFGATVAGSSGVRDSEQGLAGAVLNASRQIGSAVGVAVLLSVARARRRDGRCRRRRLPDRAALGHGWRGRRRAGQPACQTRQRGLLLRGGSIRGRLTTLVAETARRLPIVEFADACSAAEVTLNACEP